MLVSLLSSWKINSIFKLEVSFELTSLVAPLSRQVDGIVGQTNTLSNPPFHVNHIDAILWGIGCRLGYIRHLWSSAYMFDFLIFAICYSISDIDCWFEAYNGIVDCLPAHIIVDLFSMILGHWDYSVALPRLIPFSLVALFARPIFCPSEASTSTCLQKGRSIMSMTAPSRLHVSSLHARQIQPQKCR